VTSFHDQLDVASRLATGALRRILWHDVIIDMTVSLDGYVGDERTYERRGVAKARKKPRGPQAERCE
jgi:hypothetical protein